jgi:hypothetical protein
MNTVLIAMLGFLLMQAPATSRKKLVDPQAAPSPVSSVTPSVSQSVMRVQPSAGDGEEDKLRAKALDDRVQKLEHSQTNSWIVALIGALAVLSAALVGIIGQYFAAKSEDRRSILAAARAADLGKQEALYKHTEKILEFRLRQMEQFYAPMFALLEQSEGLYNKMRHQLVQDQPDKYRWAPGGEPSDGKVQVLDNTGQWHGFRLLDQFPVVRQNPNALALADQVLNIGKQITAIITERAGLAAEDLVEVLGKYLAHYAILSAVRNDKRIEPYPPGSHEMGYYPRELNSKIEAGYREVMEFIAEYANATKGLVESLPSVRSRS